jgi:hypothetical protein
MCKWVIRTADPETEAKSAREVLSKADLVAGQIWTWNPPARYLMRGNPAAWVPVTAQSLRLISLYVYMSTVLRMCLSVTCRAAQVTSPQLVM